METTPGKLIREVRRRRGLSQARLAIRAGTTQSAISRIERDQVSPSVATLRSLLHLLGEELELGVSEPDSGIDRSMIRHNLTLEPAARARRSLDWADVVRRNRPSRTAA